MGRLKIKILGSLYAGYVLIATLATKLVNAISTTQETSIELWMTPHDTVQHGPARIVSLSRDTKARNFTLGQEGTDIQFRLRTPVTGNNGTPLALKTTSGVLTRDAFHIVATYKDHIQRLYVNGAEQPETLNLRTDGIIGFGTRKTAIAQLAYSFFYSTPVSFVCAVFLSRFEDSMIGVLIPAGVTVGLLAFTEVFQAFAFSRTIDVGLMAYGVMFAVLGALSGELL